jgi:colanic acid/amylovoran biosynthesis glycosyltransferase
MSADEKIAVVCEKFPLVSQTFVQLHAEILGADVFALELTAPVGDPRWAGRVHTLGIEPGRHRLRVLVEKVYRRLAGTPWRVWLPHERRRLRQLLQQHHITAVVVEFGQCFIGCGAAVFAPGVKVVPYFHGVDLSACLRNPRYVRKLRPLLNHCSDAIVVNELMVDRLRKVLGFAGKIHVVPCAVDISIFGNLNRPSHAGINFLFVGRLVEKKGVAELVGAFARYAELGGLGTLTIAGDGPMRGAVEKIIEAFELRERVELKGAVSHERAAALMAAADVYAQHSKVAADGDEEGWPVAIAEACAAGLPVVATYHAAIPQQVLDGQTGFLVKEGDLEGMARAMLELANSPSRREQMGRAAQAHIQQFCDPLAYRNRLVEILKGARPAMVEESGQSSRSGKF